MFKKQDSSSQSNQSTNRILPGIQCFAWNGDRSMVAICPTNNEIWVFEANNQEDISKWTKVACLKEHFNVISSLDWHPKTNLLMSASTDRGVIVWAPGAVKGEFSPQIGMIKEQRANLDAVWNTRGDIFAVATTSGDVHIGTYSSQNNFWVAHPFNAKKPIHKASVLCVRFDPLSGRVVASSSLDGTVVITSCYKADLEYDSAGPFGKITSYGQTLYSISNNGWVNSLTFSPGSSTLSYVTHDCEVNFCNLSQFKEEDGKGQKLESTKIMHNGNPHLGCIFINDDKLIAVGYDKVPYVYAKDGSSWKMIKCLDDGLSKTRAAKITGNAFLDKKVYFNPDFKLASNVSQNEADTKHANFINCVKPFVQDGNKISQLCTSDINGYLCYWDVTKV